jgi:hypothetical protein
MNYNIKPGLILKPCLKSLFILVVLSTLCTCVDPFIPKLGGYTSLMVVDGLITDSNNSNTITLSRTFQDTKNGPQMISDASVYISDDNENSYNLINKGNGIYKTDSLEFKGTLGRTYILHIQTDGSVYESDPCIMQSVPDIESIYFEKEEQLINNGTQSQEGIGIYLDSKGGDRNQFYRWAFDETWKFKIPYPKRFNFNMADSAITGVNNVKEFCWKNRKSGDILIYSNFSGQSLPIKKEPIFFIAADQSDRLLIQYSILVNQFSISKKEYDFWNNLKQVNESGGDIFSKLPFTVVGNIKNVNNPKERVLGFFQVSAVKQKRIYITLSDIAGLDLPYFHYSCERFVKDPSDYPKGPGVPPTTWAEIYSMWCVTSDYYFVEPQYSSGRNISKMVFAKPECANCELTGTSKKPDFWVDLN